LQIYWEQLWCELGFGDAFVTNDEDGELGVGESRDLIFGLLGLLEAFVTWEIVEAVGWEGKG